jgi:hypothetical protein
LGRLRQIIAKEMGIRARTCIIQYMNNMVHMAGCVSVKAHNRLRSLPSPISIPCHNLFSCPFNMETKSRQIVGTEECLKKLCEGKIKFFDYVSLYPNE